MSEPFQHDDAIELRAKGGKTGESVFWRPGVFIDWDENRSYCFITLNDCRLCGDQHDMHRVYVYDLRPGNLLDRLAVV